MAEPEIRKNREIKEIVFKEELPYILAMHIIPPKPIT